MPKKDQQNLGFHLHTSIAFIRRYVQCCIESDQARVCSCGWQLELSIERVRSAIRQGISEQISVKTWMQAWHSSSPVFLTDLVPTISLFPVSAGLCREHQAVHTFKDSKWTKSDHMNILIKHNPGYRNSGTRILLASRSIACYRHLCQEAMYELLVGNVRGAMPKKHQQNLVFHLHTSIEFTRRYHRHVQCCIESDQARVCSYDSFMRGTIMGTG